MEKTSSGISQLRICRAVVTFLALYQAASGQVSSTAYRGLGQTDLTRNGLNRVQGNELAAPAGIALDTRGSATHIYIADTGNHRVLGWPDAAAYQNGDAPVVVLGQPSLEHSGPMGTGDTGLRSPAGLAVDPLTGNLYVADRGNHRVLRFPDPFANPSQAEPDAVYGQADFTTRTANSSADGRNGLRDPAAVACDESGNLWIADTGNHRIVRFSAGVLNSSSPSADIVLGQQQFTDTERNRSGAAITAAGFDSPSGLTFDSGGNLYVADSVNARILRFTAPFTAASTAGVVLAMPRGARAYPAGIAAAGAMLYVAVPQEHRLLALTGNEPSAAPVNVLGQSDLNSRDKNAGVYPAAAAFSLADPADAKVDRSGHIYVADAGNNRVLRFPSGSRSADRVWGQLDFASNSVNQVKPAGLNGPGKVVVDYSQDPFALYVADTNNHRILVWKDSARVRTGDPADMVIGQPDFRSAIPNAFGKGRQPTSNSLSGPKGIAVDSQGHLYVADSGNNRVLRFPRPVASLNPPTADMVLGHSDFSTAPASLTSAASLRSPSAVAIGPDGNVFVSDTGNNRVLEFAATGASGAAAIRVYGQPNFVSSAGSRVVSAQTLTQPAGIALDPAFNLFVADSGANRVVIYANTRDAASASNAAAVVIGSDRFDARLSGSDRSRLQSPSDVGLDSAGRIYIADSGNHRVLVFPSLIFLPITDGGAIGVAGQPEFTSAAANWNAREGLSTPEALSGPSGLFVDRRDTLYVADTGNHRVVHFLKASRISHRAFPQASALGRGSVAAIEGDGLADSEATSGTPLAAILADRKVVVDDGMTAPISAVTPASVEFQVPWNAPGGAPRVAVRVGGTDELIAGASVTIATYAPGLFTRVLHQDGTTNSESTPAVRGSVIRLTGTGQGPVSPSLAAGEAAPAGVQTIAVPTSDGNTCLTRQPSVCVAIGNTFGEIRFSGLAPGLVGVWQLDVRIPENAPVGVVPVRAVINAAPSNIVNVAIR